MTEIKNGTIGMLIEDESIEHNWIGAHKCSPGSENGRYLALYTIYLDGEWIINGFKKDNPDEQEKTYFLIKGKWYPSKGEWLKIFNGSTESANKSKEIQVKEIQDIMRGIKDDQND